MPTAQNGSVIKRAPGRYEARWSDHEHRRRAKLFKSKTDAKAFLKDEVKEVAERRSSLGEVSNPRPATVDALLDVFLEKHGRTVDPATERNLRTQLKKARTTFGDRAPDSLTKSEVEDWRLELPAGSCHGVFRAFRQALTWGVDRNLLDTNASEGIKNPVRKRHERREVFPFESWADIDAIALELANPEGREKTYPTYAALVVVGVGTGLRPEELYGLHRSDIDRERRVIHVQRRFTQGLVKQGTKTGGLRLVPFGEKVLAALDSMPPRIDTPILFPAPRGGYIDDNKFRWREWTPALRAAGIPHRRINDMRHTYASWSLAADVPIAKLAKMMGTSVGQLEDTYHRFLRVDEARYATVLDTFGVAV